MNFTMPAHLTLSDVRSWFGLVNQVAPFLAVTPIMEHFRELLKKPAGKVVYWKEHLEAIFLSAKETIRRLTAEGLRHYTMSRTSLPSSPTIAASASDSSLCSSIASVYLRNPYCGAQADGR